MSRIELWNHGDTFNLSLKFFALIVVGYATVLLLNFIASKNGLTNNSNYEILLFGLFLLFISSTTLSGQVLVSNFFILLAIRRIVSLRTEQHMKKKLFDAAFWIGVASLFYFWAILFFILVVLSLVLFADHKLRHWIIPFLGLATLFVIACACSVVMYNDFFTIFNYPPEVSYDFSNYNSLKYIIALTVLFSFGVWSSIFYLQNIKKQKKNFRASFKVIVLAMVIAFAIIVVAPNKNGSEFLFLFAPLSIIVANYIEIIHEKWFKEAFLGVLVVLPFILLLL
ncbi:hypothetical protein KFZ70_05490 [Tamlana fucoidanivorans]|uniref:Beta-carotene 15,15'-monooxygenase n=2 Tax=Allotamlana fucoidanivorans TaxID=2583814 RepID=A0A5C4SSD9_9FLAO|nr:hypothetical protein FGF67_00485 [Tamlana fucoidanivorans]